MAARLELCLLALRALHVTALSNIQDAALKEFCSWKLAAESCSDCKSCADCGLWFGPSITEPITGTSRACSWVATKPGEGECKAGYHWGTPEFNSPEKMTTEGRAKVCKDYDHALAAKLSAEEANKLTPEAAARKKEADKLELLKEMKRIKEENDRKEYEWLKAGALAHLATEPTSVEVHSDEDNIANARAAQVKFGATELADLMTLCREGKLPARTFAATSELIVHTFSPGEMMSDNDWETRVLALKDGAKKVEVPGIFMRDGELDPIKIAFDTNNKAVINSGRHRICYLNKFFLTAITEVKITCPSDFTQHNALAMQGQCTNSENDYLKRK